VGISSSGGEAGVPKGGGGEKWGVEGCSQEESVLLLCRDSGETAVGKGGGVRGGKVRGKRGSDGACRVKGPANFAALKKKEREPFVFNK